MAVGPSAGYIIYFGSGRYFAANDNNSKDLSTLYGIWDSGSPVIAGRAALSAQIIQASDHPTSPDTRIVTRRPLSYLSKHGWYVDLVVQGQDPQGERSIATPLLQGACLLFDLCAGSECELCFGREQLALCVRCCFRWCRARSSQYTVPWLQIQYR